MKQLVLALTALSMIAMWTGCSQNTQSEAGDVAEEAMEATDAAAEDAAEVVEDAADEVEDSMN
jgi:hypothetical protein